MAGNRTLVKTALGETCYTFDARNWLDTVIAASGTTDYDYNAVGNLTHTHFGNGTEENRQYDDLNRLKYLENKEADGDLISSYTYTLDKVGNRQSVAEHNGRTVNYTYDELYRLTQEQVLDAVNGNHTSGYIYDNVGNRLTKTDSAEDTTTYTYDNNDRLLEEKVAGQVKTTYTYDDNGNTLTKTEPGQETRYTWDDQNRLVAADITTAAGMKHLEYEYDTSGIRVASKVDGQETRYLIDANQPYAQVLEEYTTDGTVLTAYVYGNDLLSQTQYDPQTHIGSTTYYHVDGLGSTTALTDETGTVVSTSRYDAFGGKTEGTGDVANKYLFAGEQYDSNLGDYYLRARYYDSDSGRFIRRDSYAGSITEPLTLQKYIYANNNPTNATDPTGLTTLLEIAEDSATAGIIDATPYATVANPITVQRAVAAGVLLLLVGYAAGAILERAVRKDGNIELKLYPDDEAKRRKIDASDPRDINQMRVQVQDAPGHTLGAPIYNVPEVGVTLTQVFQAVGALWQERDSITKWLSRDYDTALIKGMSFVTQTAKDIQRYGGTSNSGREQLATFQWDQRDFSGKNATTARGSIREGDRKYYRVDFENIRGRNLKV